MDDFSTYPKFTTSHNSEAPIFLIDMDGVIVDFEGHVYEQWERKYPSMPLVPRHERVNFYIDHDHPDDHRARLRKIMCAPGAFYNSPPFEGVREYLNQLVEFGEVFICTSPMLSNKTCMQDKMYWIERHLGEEWQDRVVITKDKTTVRGTWLVDDRPSVEGVLVPTWQHIVFGQPYNVNVEGCRVDGWPELIELARRDYG